MPTDCIALVKSLRRQCEVFAKYLRIHFGCIAKSRRMHCELIANSLRTQSIDARAHSEIVANSLRTQLIYVRAHAVSFSPSAAAEWAKPSRSAAATAGPPHGVWDPVDILKTARERLARHSIGGISNSSVFIEYSNSLCAKRTRNQTPALQRQTLHRPPRILSDTHLRLKNSTPSMIPGSSLM